jgi:uncharacterized protein with NRDE domain
MCLILLAWRMREDFPLILAANRDEFYARPTAPAAFWAESPELLGGRDLKAGGTWLGITRAGRWAALTNYRDPAAVRPDAPSRGRLVSDYLSGEEAPEACLRRIESDAGQYNGFNLLLGDRGQLFCFSSRGERRRLEPGLYGLSNRLLDDPWPKIERGKRGFREILARPGGPAPEAFLTLLADQERPPDAALPDTGVGLAWERILSPLFIASEHYGTRSSTVLTIDRQGGVAFVERLFQGGRDPWMTSRFDFRIAAAGRAG